MRSLLSTFRHRARIPVTHIVHADRLEHLRTTADRYDALCLDIDNGPDWTVTEDNGSLYSPPGSRPAGSG